MSELAVVVKTPQVFPSYLESVAYTIISTSGQNQNLNVGVHHSTLRVADSIQLQQCASRCRQQPGCSGP